MELICFVLGLLIIAASVFFAVKNRNSTKKRLAYINLGIFFSTFFMALPAEWVQTGKTVVSPFWYSFVSSLLYSLKALTGGSDISRLETVPLNGWLKILYIAVVYSMFIAAPLMASSLLLSFFGDTLQRIRYRLCFTPKCFVFSALNENSVVLAESIKRERGHKTIVFCNAKKADDVLAERARAIGGILLYRPCTALKIKKCAYEYYLISEDEDKNIHDAKVFIARQNKPNKRGVKINVFTQGGTNVAILENLLSKQTPAKPICRFFETFSDAAVDHIDRTAGEADLAVFLKTNKKTLDRSEKLKNAKRKDRVFSSGNRIKTRLSPDEKTDYSAYKCILVTETRSPEETPRFKESAVHVHGKTLRNGWAEEPFQMRFIDEISLFCNQQIFDHPLYEKTGEENEINVMIAGCGRWGMRMLKTVLWAGQIDGYPLSIRVYDKNAPEIEKALYQQCPAIKDADLRFIKADFFSDDLEKKTENEPKATYVCVATGEDDLNLRISEELFRIFRRNNHFGATPPIFTRIRNAAKSANYDARGSYLTERNIHLFGTADSFFSKETLFNTWLEKLSFATHLCYCGALDGDEYDVNYLEAKRSFFASEYNRRSSMATALHFGAKMLLCRGKNDTAEDKKEQFGKDKIKEYENNLDGKRNLLMKNEHDRWNFFLACEGWRAATASQLRTYYQKTGKHKDDLSKMHPCLIPYEDLDSLDRDYDALLAEQNKPPRKENQTFKNNDRLIVDLLPDIVKRANELYRKENRHVSAETD